MGLVTVLVIFLVLVGQSVATSDQHKQFCRAHFNDKLERFLCFAGRTLVDTHPVGKFSLYILDKYFGTGSGNNQPKPWDLVKADVEKLVNDKFESYQIQTLQLWQKSISARIASCTLKVNVGIKRSCYKNLQEDLAGFEPIFRGSSAKEKILFLKYYDIYVATFMSVSFLLRDISGEALKMSIERDIKHKAKIFSDHLTEMLPLTRAYACRHIKIKLIESYVLWEEVRLVWPNYNEINRYIQPHVDEAYVANALLNQTGHVNKCGFLDTTNTYLVNIIDTRDDSEYPGGKTRGRYCKNNLAIQSLVPKKFAFWKIFMKMCVDDHDKVSFSVVEERLNSLKDIL